MSSTKHPAKPPLWRRLVKAALILVAAALLGVAALWVASLEGMGGRPEGARLEAMQKSPQWRGEKFDNPLPRVDAPAGKMIRALAFGGAPFRKPTESIPLVARTKADYDQPPASGLRVTWLGHSILLLEIDGQRVLIDPVWGKRAAPVSFAGPKRFFAPPLPLSELPTIDAVIISHDHYDHLDMPTVKALLARGVRWIAPLGVGAHLVKWGVPESAITELDWWGDVVVGGLTITATPARHFSGRSLMDQSRTLWAGWAFAGSAHRVFYSGDTALHDEFVAIGERLGPFDLTMIEAGAYSALWADVHLGPEQAVLAHQLVKGAVMLPVHWGMFDLALHGWTEPMERVLVAAESLGVRVVSPRPGEMVEPAVLGPQQRWWPVVAWQTVGEAPAWSSGVQPHLSALPNTP
jgi:L-ascorbate metabolism protein UlaG (beta-lactamase superfamily)